MFQKLALATMVMFALAACSKQNSNQAENVSAPASASIAVSTNTGVGKTYKVGMDYTYAPYNMRGTDTAVAGLEVDILNAIAKNQGFQVEYVPMLWKTLVLNLEKENFHIIMDGLATDDMMSYPAYIISQPYMRSGDCVFTLKPEHQKDWAKNKVSVQPEDLLDDELASEHGVNKQNIRHVKTLIMGLQEVVRQESQSVVSDCAALHYTAKNPLFKDYHFAETLLPGSEAPETADLGFGVKKDDAELLEKINTGLQNIKQSGELDAIIKKWTE